MKGVVAGTLGCVLTAVAIGALRREPVVTPVGPADALAAAESGGDYLVRHFHPDAGRFDYLYDPVSDETAPSYNLVRHAGTAYALVGLYAETGRPAYLDAATTALDYLVSRQAPCPAPHGDLVCLYEHDGTKLGTNALGVLALAELARVTGDAGALERARALGEWIVATQDVRGAFTLHEQDRDGTLSERVSTYYPGEAVFALARLAEVDPDAKWRDAAERGARWLIDGRDAGVATADLPHDHWLLYGLDALCRTSCPPAFVEHARRLTDAIAGAQLVDDDDPDRSGAFRGKPRSTPTATRVEGLLAAHALFTREGDDAYARKALDVVDRAVPFLLRNQVTTARAKRAGLVAASALGGFTASLDRYEIRIDYVQHSISALLAYRAAREAAAPPPATR